MTSRMTHWSPESTIALIAENGGGAGVRLQKAEKDVQA